MEQGSLLHREYQGTRSELSDLPDHGDAARRLPQELPDKLDAWLLADILRTDRHLHRPMLPVSEQVRELRELTRGREALVHESVRIVNGVTAPFWVNCTLRNQLA